MEVQQQDLGHSKCLLDSLRKTQKHNPPSTPQHTLCTLQHHHTPVVTQNHTHTTINHHVSTTQHHNHIPTTPQHHPPTTIQHHTPNTPYHDTPITSYHHISTTPHHNTTIHDNQKVDIKWTPQYGRYLVASRDISAGEVLLREAPLLVLPKIGSNPACLSCLKRLKHEDWCGCGGCGGPLCHPHCSGTNHLAEECSLLRRLGLREAPHIDALLKELNILIGPLRLLLLMQESMSAKDILLSLESHKEKRCKMAIGNFIQEHILGGLRSRLGLEVNPDTVHHVCGVLDTNAFEVSLDQGDRGRALSVLASMMNHSCLPNAQRWYSEGQIVVQASRDIAEGCPILINYTQTLWGTQARATHLSTFKMFLCKCERCADPTELGSHLSSVRCRECDDDLLVPPAESRGPWRCRGCGVGIDCGTVEIMVRAGAGALSKLHEADITTASLILEHLKKVLGHSHYVVMQAKQALLHTIVMNSKLQDLASEDLKKAVYLSEDLLDLTFLVEPGRTRLKGLLLYQLAEAHTELLRRGESAEEHKGGKITKDDVGGRKSEGRMEKSLVDGANLDGKRENTRGNVESRKEKGERSQVDGKSLEGKRESIRGEGESKEEKMNGKGESKEEKIKGEGERQEEKIKGEGERQEEKIKVEGERKKGGEMRKEAQSQDVPITPQHIKRLLNLVKECESILQFDRLLPNVQDLSSRVQVLAAHHLHV
ncbi:hypothetical protein Pmani_008665 [Petrolisthes manimaculis]|uniref:SET domain-containing protein n=1 Tax=Petrolisthes manimaculis TaxID=1843537 RepID=A0AAE1Q6I3_9EUCA|nr:hypothetical protein Pmani_008665 [Petrolisthes manimaculis]